MSDVDIDDINYSARRKLKEVIEEAGEDSLDVQKQLLEIQKQLLKTFNTMAVQQQELIQEIRGLRNDLNPPSMNKPRGLNSD